MQNTPKRDKQANRAVRSGMVPEDGCVLVEGDFSGAEIVTSCFPGYTLVETIAGPTTIKDIIANISNGLEVYVYGYNHKKGRMGVAKVRGGKLSGISKELWAVTLDNGERIEVTPDHKFVLRNGSELMVRDLEVGQSLMPFYKGVGSLNSGTQYTWIKLNNTSRVRKGRSQWAHRLILEDVFGVLPGDGLVAHHIDMDGTNNDLPNIEVLTKSEHIKRHLVINGNKGVANPNFGNKMPDHVRASIIAANTGRPSWNKGLSTGPLSEEHKNKIAASIVGKPCPQRGTPGCTPWNKGVTTGCNLTEENIKHISECKKEYWNSKPNEICRICNGSFRSITNTHLKRHGISIEEYRSKHNHKVVSIEKCVRFDDVYNIEVEGIHNYALSAGVVVKNCTYHLDPTFIKYQMDDNADMHRDAAARIWMAENIVSKPVRQAIKSGFTFSQFYGSYYVSCAIKMWEEMLDMELTNGVKLRDHIAELDLLDFVFSDGTTLRGKLAKELAAKNIRIEDLTLYERFEFRVRAFEQQFWNEWFPIYTKWKKEIFESYLKNGYIETHFGFRFRGYMDRKQAANYPIQGCLQGGSLVQTIDGWVPIEKLVGKKVKVWTGFKWADAIGVDRGPCQTAKVRLFSGMEINCDTRHYLKNEEHEWVHFEDLKIGNKVSLPLVREREPIPLLTDIWFLLGFIVGDGSLLAYDKTTKHRRVVLEITGGIGKLDILHDLCFILRGYHSKWFTRANVTQVSPTKYRLHVEGRGVEKLLNQYGMVVNKNAHTKRIPSAVWCATKEQQASFMEGLWLSDGSRGCTDYRSLHMCNYSLLKEVQVLTYGLGYDSKIRKTDTGFKLCFHNMYPKGEYSTRKMPRGTLDRLCSGKVVALVKGDNTSITDRRNQLSGKDIGQPIAERIVRRLVGDVEMYRYDTIEEIRVSRYIKNTYTMAVDDELHQFVADGVIHKNTSFHMLLYSLIKLDAELKIRGMKTKLVGQIHDSVVAQVPIDEVEEYCRIFTRIVKNLQNELPWLCIPMVAEMEVSKPRSEGGSFADMKPIHMQ